MSYYPPGVTGNEPHLTGEPEPEECPTCEGRGAIEGGRPMGGPATCPRCEGDGVIVPEEPEPEWEPPEEL